MRQSVLLTAALAALLTSACGPGEVVVIAEIDVADPETGTMISRPLPNLRVDLLPYDRDLVFDSLTQASPTPEPEIPADVLAAQAEIAAAAEEWRNQENRWGVLRDTLQRLTEAMGRLSPASAEYRILFQDEAALRGQHDAAEVASQRAFARYDSLTAASIARQQEVRLIRETWADDAYADVALVFRDRIRSSGLDMAVDTTDTAGLTTFRVKPGQYWVHARLDQPFTELYWNVPITVVRGEPISLTLSRANAQERPRL